MNRCITTNTAEENRATPGEALDDCAAGAQPKKEKSLVKNQTLDSCWRQRSLCWVTACGENDYEENPAIHSHSRDLVMDTARQPNKYRQRTQNRATKTTTSGRLLELSDTGSSVHALASEEIGRHKIPQKNDGRA
jgi:hypothetical protein